MELVTILANYVFGKHNSELVIFKLAIQLLTSLFLSLWWIVCWASADGVSSGDC